MSRGESILTEKTGFLMTQNERDKLELLALAAAGGRLGLTLRSLITAADEHDVRKGLVRLTGIQRPKKSREGSSNEYATKGS